MKLFFIDGQKKGDSFELSPPGASIGRELDNDIILEGEGESRYHAKLETDGKDWKIKDLGSTNGTKHNGTKLTPNQAVLLKEGDTLAIGKQTMLFAEKLTDKVDEIIVVDPKDEKKDDKKEDSTEEKKDETPAPSIIAIKAPSPTDETIPYQDPISEKKDIDENSSKSFSDFFGDKEDDKKDGANSFSDSTDFFGKTKQNLPEVQKGDKKKHAGILFYIGVLGVTVILVGIFIFIEQIKPKPIDTTTTTVPKKTGAPLLIRYEKQVTTTSPKINIFRYLMEIKDGKVTITKDDVQSKYKAKLSREVGAEQINELEDRIRDTDFMETEQPQLGIASDEEDKSQSLTIAYGKEMNSVTVKNTPPPRSFVETITALEEFSSNVLNIPPVSLTPEEMQEAGLDAYRKAKQLYDNYQAKEENLNTSIKYFKIAEENLKGFKHMPEYEQSYQLKNQAEQILQAELRQHDVNYRRHINLKNYMQAKEECLSVMAKTESGSKAYKLAKGRLIQVETEIKKKRR